MGVQSLGQEDPLENEKATHSSTLMDREAWQTTIHGVIKESDTRQTKQQQKNLSNPSDNLLMSWLRIFLLKKMVPEPAEFSLTFENKIWGLKKHTKIRASITEGGPFSSGWSTGYTVQLDLEGKLKEQKDFSVPVLCKIGYNSFFEA